MPFSTAAKNTMLQALDAANTTGAKTLSAHTAYSTTGGNEVTGGSPAYARQAATWNAASGGVKTLASVAGAFNIPAGTSVAFIGMWDGSGTPAFLGMVPNGAGAVQFFEMDDSTADTFKAVGHGYANGQTVVLFNVNGGSTLPTGVTEGTIYYVVSSTTNNFQVSATSGGSAINLTAVGNGSVKAITVESFGSQGTFTVQTSGSQLDLNAL